MCGDPARMLPLSKSFFKSLIWRAPEALPRASAEFGVFPSLVRRPMFHKCRKPDLNPTSMEGGRLPLCCGILTICQCDTVGPHFLPPRGPALEISLDCVPTIQGLSRRGAQAQASFHRGTAEHRERGLSQRPDLIPPHTLASFEASWAWPPPHLP